MMILKRSVFRMVLSATLLLGGFFLRNAVGSESPKPNDLNETLEKLREQFHAPALAAAAIRDGQIAAIGSVGVRDLKSNTPVTVDDRTMIGSCGKAATRLLIGRLVDQNRLRWDSTLGELLPDVTMRDEYKSVTLGDIVGHRGGLQPYTQVTPKLTPILFAEGGSARERRAAFVAHLLSEAPAAPPKSRFVYSNGGYGLLGHIAERVLDKPYEQLMRDEVFRPLDMKSASVGMPREIPSIPGWTGHERTPNGFETVARDRQGLPAIAPAGFMSCNIADFARLGATLVDIETGTNRGYLGKAAIERLPELRPGSRNVEGEIFFGGDGQFTAAFALWKSKGLAIVVQTNAGDSDDLCEATIDAVRAAVAPELPTVARQATRRGGPGGGGPGARPSGPEGGGGQRGTYGFQIEAGDDDDWSVAGVLPGSPAERAGLKTGDAIVAINGKSLADLDPDERMAAVRRSPLKLGITRDGKPLEIMLKAE